jgi:7,8-dihydropterin-6-yl-methyl-4-(beta-D-ribofuranosyl)aminobenzene 5'-phosphate synthase
MNILQITTLVENTAGGKGLLAEHGFSLWIEYNNRKILFDTGQGYVLNGNAKKLGIDLSDADAIVLSHGHYDHTGGLFKLDDMGKKPIFTHKDSLLPKYSRHPDGSVHKIGIKSVKDKTLNFKFNDKPVELYKGFHLTGVIPRITDFEDTGGQFFCDKECQQVDNLIDDQAAFIETSAGLFVILGCAHSGVINTLEYISKLTGSHTIHTLIGGMHLGSASQERINKTVKALKKFDIQNLYPTHCTGFNASARLLQEFPKNHKICQAGTIIKV